MTIVTAGWGDFLVATAGAAAALAGLVFVALSINLARILQLPGVASRAGETILLLAAALVASLIALVPGLTSRELGLLMLVVWLPTWLQPTRMQIRELRLGQYYRFRHAVLRVGVHQLSTLWLLFAGIALCMGAPHALYWFATAIVSFMIVALVNAWVLLVEILR